jgi:hypothetical protein
MTDLEALLIGGRWALPQFAVESGRIVIDLSISMAEVGELSGSDVDAQITAGGQLLAKLIGPAPDGWLPCGSTGAVSGFVTFVFDNPQNLPPTELAITINGQTGTFHLGDTIPIASAPPPPPPQTTSLRIALLRPDDLVNLEVEAINLDLDTGDRRQPELTPGAGGDAFLVVRFPPQTTIEAAFYESGGTEQQTDPASDVVRKVPTPASIAPQPAGDVAARMGGNSRLVFRVPPGTRIPYTFAGLLDWTGLELHVAPAADVAANAEPPAPALAIREPGPIETTIEMPYRLHLSPTHDVGWQHATGIVSHRGRAELWHTRMVVSDDAGHLQPTNDQRTVGLRAIWSPDYNPALMPSPADLSPLGTLTAMSACDRHQIVVLTSAYRGYAADAHWPFVPQPIQASLLMLSPLGGWLRSVGMWDPPYKTLPPLRPEAAIPLDFLIRQAGAGRHHTDHAAAAPAATDRTTIIPAAQAISRDDRSRQLFEEGRDLALPPRYRIDRNQQLDLSQWTHVAAQGRDHYVRMVYEGHLKEFGHRASLVKVTERRFEAAPDSGAPVAYLRQYMYIVVREPEKDYRNAGLQNDGRGMPLGKVRLTTLVTPHIDYPYSAPSAITDRSFWVMAGGRDFLFHGVAEDVAGNTIDFTKALIFVPNSEANLAAVHNEFNAVANRERRAAAVPGQQVTFAPADAASENTRFMTLSLNFENEDATRDNFFKPRLFKANVRIPAVEQISGANTPTTIRLAPAFLAGGFDDPANQSGLFAEVVTQDAGGALASAGLDVAFSAQQAGGFATPNLAITSLTSRVGPLGGDVTKALANQFDPTQIFKKGLATLFGVFDLADLLPQGSADQNAPKMQVRRDGAAVITELDWISAVAPPPLPAAIVTFREYPDTVLTVHGEFRKELAAAAGAAFTLRGVLNHFDLEFFNVLKVNFSQFTFTAASGSKIDVNVALDDSTPVQFVGDLEFVEGLRALIPPGAFGDGVSIDLVQSPLGVKASLGLTLPPAEVGVFALKNISFFAGLTIPFLNGKPIVDFAFARRDNPFLLVVSLLGGGGFFHVELDTDGIRLLEAAFEFGAIAAIDIGVASGEVHIMAGIYFKMEKKVSPQFGNKEVMMSTLCGYLRCGGKLSVLGLVSVSVEFYLCFTYVVETKKASGRATLTVCVEIACFSKSVELTVERSFGGEGGDPTFAQLMESPQVWAEYADAYA